MSRRTETAYKGRVRGQVGTTRFRVGTTQRSPGFSGYGKCCGCVATVHALIRGGLFNRRSSVCFMEEAGRAKPEEQAHGVIR